MENQDNADTQTDSSDDATGNVLFPQRYTDRLKQGSAENIERLKATRQYALEGIDRDLEAFGRNDHGLDPEIVDQFVSLLKCARQELLGSDTLTVEQGDFLLATGKRLEGLVGLVEHGIKDTSTD
jgi:hypothetical protein